MSFKFTYNTKAFAGTAKASLTSLNIMYVNGEAYIKTLYLILVIYLFVLYATIMNLLDFQQPLYTQP